MQAPMREAPVRSASVLVPALLTLATAVQSLQGEEIVGVPLQLAVAEARAEVEGPVTAVDRAAVTFTVDDDGVTVVVRVTSETIFVPESDFTDFASMADAFDAGAMIEAAAEGVVDESGVLVADEVGFEVAEREEEEEDEEVEVAGLVTAVDRMAETFTVDDNGVMTVVLVTIETTFSPNSDFMDFTSMADAFDAGTRIEATAEGAIDESGVLVATLVEFQGADAG